MPTIRTIHNTDQVKVAVVFEEDSIRVWFQVAGHKPVKVSQVCALWYCTNGAAKIMNFDVCDGRERYCLSYDTLTLSWSLGRTVIE